MIKPTVTYPGFLNPNRPLTILPQYVFSAHLLSICFFLFLYICLSHIVFFFCFFPFSHMCWIIHMFKDKIYFWGQITTFTLSI